MMGKVAVDEYILGAMMLYIDIIRMLLYILMLFGKKKWKKENWLNPGQQWIKIYENLS